MKKVSNFCSLLILFFLVFYQFDQSRALEYDYFDGGECHFLTPKQELGDDNRLAVVIGNGAYNPDVGWLENAPEDALAIAEKFRLLGFKVALSVNVDIDTMSGCIDAVLSDHNDIDVAAFYYSGHGVQVNDSNYIVPVDIEKDELSLEKFYQIDEVIHRLRSQSKITIGFLDACRNNPLSISSSKGLSVSSNVNREIPMQLEGANLINSVDRSRLGEYLMAYSTSPYSTAEDGDGNHSPFTQALISKLGRPSISLQQSLVEVNYVVGSETNWFQTPFIRSSVSSLLMLNNQIDYKLLSDKSNSAALQSINFRKQGLRHEAVAEALVGLPEDADLTTVKRYFSPAYNALVTAYNANIYNINFDQQLHRVKVSKNGKTVAGLFIDNTNSEKLMVWDTKSGRNIYTVDVDGLNRHFKSLNVSLDGRYVVYPTQSKYQAEIDLAVLDVEDGSVTNISKALENVFPMSSSTPQIRSLEFNENNDLIIVAGGNKNPIRIFDRKTGNLKVNISRQQLGIIGASGYHVGAARFASQNKFCFLLQPYSSNSLFVGVFDYDKKSLDWNQVVPEGNINYDISCSKDGEKVSAVIYDSNWALKLLLFNKSKNSPILISDQQFDWLTARFSDNSEKLVLLESTGNRFFQADTGEFIYKQQDQFEFASGLFSKNNKAIWQSTSEELSDNEIFGNGLTLNELRSAAMSELPQSLAQYVNENRLKLD